MRLAHCKGNTSGSCVFISYRQDVLDAGIRDLGPRHVNLISQVITFSYRLKGAVSRYF